MGKKVKYLVLDTETATLPFVSDMGLNPDQKKKIAIARPLVYDIGWTIGTRTDGIIEKRNFLVAETFSVPSIFNTAYYAYKRPIYLEKLRNNEISVLPWNDIMDILLEDMHESNYVCAYNAMFDFCKAIPFTELYMKHLYSPDYFQWEESQKILCQQIILQPYQKTKDDFDQYNFHFRNEKFPMIDIWGLSCRNIINKDKYKRQSLEKGYITNSGTFFSSNAENTKRFLEQRFDFIEDHTALSDAEIETTILFYGIKVGKKTEGIIYFPFRELGDTVEFAIRDKKVTKQMMENLLQKLKDYLGDADESTYTNYQKQVANRHGELEEFMLNKFWD